ncbi:MAG: hypothetical protein M1837_007434 [Sclerophora amabilis]|nr:MAG: hypothetical protein M1837_007434 [Sclerophora amabilis]
MGIGGTEKMVFLLILCVQVGLASPATQPSELSVRPEWIGGDFGVPAKFTLSDAAMDSLFLTAYKFVHDLRFDEKPIFSYVCPYYLKNEDQPRQFDRTQIPRNLCISMVFWNGWEKRYRGPAPSRLMKDSTRTDFRIEDWIQERYQRGGRNSHFDLSGRLHTPNFDYSIFYVVGVYEPGDPKVRSYNYREEFTDPMEFEEARHPTRIRGLREEISKGMSEDVDEQIIHDLTAIVDHFLVGH